MRKSIAFRHAAAITCVATAAAVAQTSGRPGGTVDHSAFDAILRENVREQGVDYLNIRQNHWHQLRRYLDRLADVDAETLSRDEQLAYYINLYNATVIYVVTDRFREGFSVSQDDFGLFNERLVRLKGRTVSLNDLEHRIIRPTFKDPRIHAALVCAARSCPSVLPRAYAADDIDPVLEENMRRFLNDPRRNKIDLENKELRLSSIFKWYAEDFGGRSGLADYVNRYVSNDVSGFNVAFMEYSWALNVVRPRAGRWVTLRGRSVPLYAAPAGPEVGRASGARVYQLLEEKDQWLRLERRPGEENVWVKRSTTSQYVVSK